MNRRPFRYPCAVQSELRFAERNAIISFPRKSRRSGARQKISRRRGLTEHGISIRATQNHFSPRAKRDRARETGVAKERPALVAVADAITILVRANVNATRRRRRVHCTHSTRRQEVWISLVVQRSRTRIPNTRIARSLLY